MRLSTRAGFNYVIVIGYRQNAVIGVSFEIVTDFYIIATITINSSIFDVTKILPDKTCLKCCFTQVEDPDFINYNTCLHNLWKIHN